MRDRTRFSQVLQIHTHGPGVNSVVVGDALMECFTVGFMSHKDPLSSVLVSIGRECGGGFLGDCLSLFNVIINPKIQIPKECL